MTTSFSVIRNAAIGCSVFALICCSHQVGFGQTDGLSSLSGYVYIDRDNNGQIAFQGEALPELVLGGVTIELFSTGNTAESLISSTVTDSLGRYEFTGLNAGTYRLRQTQPIEFIDGLETLGMILSLDGTPNPSGSSVGIADDNEFTDIVLTDRSLGRLYNFGELGLAPEYVSKRFLLGTAPQPDPVGTVVTVGDPTDNQTVPEPGAGVLALMGVLSLLLCNRRG